MSDVLNPASRVHSPIRYQGPRNVVPLRYGGHQPKGGSTLLIGFSQMLNHELHLGCSRQMSSMSQCANTNRLCENVSSGVDVTLLRNQAALSGLRSAFQMLGR
jgi:hypothetical protein